MKHSRSLSPPAARPVHRPLLTLGVLALMLAACASASDPTSQSTTSTSGTASSPDAAVAPALDAGAEPVDATMTTPDGRERSYRVYVPTSLPERRPVPLLVALHGGGGSGSQFEANSGFDELAEANQFIVVYPDGIEIGGATPLARGHAWNGGRCCGPAAATQVDDVGFLAALVDEVSAQYDIDSARVFAAGHSNGAIMAYRLACERSETIVAIGVQAGSLEVDDCDPSRPVSLLHIHGTADENLPIDGGRGTRGISATDFSAPRDAIMTFVRADGCSDSSTVATAPDNADVGIETWASCRAGTAVEFVTVEGASHAWMGHESTVVGQGVSGVPYPDFDSSFAIWKFLAAHPRG